VLAPGDQIESRRVDVVLPPVTLPLLTAATGVEQNELLSRATGDVPNLKWKRESPPWRWPVSLELGVGNPALRVIKARLRWCTCRGCFCDCVGRLRPEVAGRAPRVHPVLRCDPERGSADLCGMVGGPHPDCLLVVVGLADGASEPVDGREHCW